MVVVLAKASFNEPGLIVRSDNVASDCAKTLEGINNDVKINIIQKKLTHVRLTPLLDAVTARLTFPSVLLLSDVL